MEPQALRDGNFCWDFHSIYDIYRQNVPLESLNILEEMAIKVVRAGDTTICCCDFVTVCWTLAFLQHAFISYVHNTDQGSGKTWMRVLRDLVLCSLDYHFLLQICAIQLTEDMKFTMTLPKGFARLWCKYMCQMLIHFMPRRQLIELHCFWHDILFLCWLFEFFASWL